MRDENRGKKPTQNRCRNSFLVSRKKPTRLSQLFYDEKAGLENITYSIDLYRYLNSCVTKYQPGYQQLQ